eukprot:TRINITY_DN5371_c0_g1_i1.p1 TRINITY_DN5371_c0_g1~~TRINITY_DN5371_c0_g1_i1.p1  ORF type:complete len:1974 (+),score=480.18 TRINITY_DN5371_c0_g1_i1:111-6032(+)
MASSGDAEHNLTGGSSEGSSSLFQSIHEDTEFDLLGHQSNGYNSTIYRAFYTSLSNAVSVKMPIEYSKRYLKKYSKELEVGLKLKGCPCVMQYYGLRRYKKSIGLIMEDFHGVSLQQILDKREEEISIIETLRICIEISEGIRQIHQNGVIHQNLSPQHILVNRNTNQIKLIDFSFSSVLSKQNQSVLKYKKLQYSLEWISPEQSGRMNKDVDYRTDYYTFGLLLYRITCGTVPFSNSESSKLIYAHLAKAPVPPQQLNPKISSSLNQVILKLLSKNADDRYQSAFGIKYDLQFCLNELIQGKNDQNFKIGSQDVKSTFQVCQKLYGRQEEISTLLNCFEQIESGGITSRLVLVSGYSGIGKTALINEVHKPLTRSGGFFISGKIDQFNRGVPYSSLVQAFQQLIKSILTESEEVVKKWKESILSAMNGKGQIIIDVIPEVELIIGAQPSVVPLAPTENNIRFKATFIEFLKVFATKEHPLVIFLDDLQWSDVSTLVVIEELVTNDEVQHLLLIGAYRDNEVDELHPLTIITKSIFSKTPIVHISLSRLSLEHINELISDSLKSDQTMALATLVSEKTQGNPFFITVFLSNLVEEGLLQFNSKDGKWNWDSSEIRRSNITDNVVEMMTGRIRKLSEPTQKMLSIAAAIGNRFDSDVMSAITGESIGVLMDNLWPAVKDELLLLYGEESPLAFNNNDLRYEIQNFKLQFMHDRVQQASYELTPIQDRPKIHLSIGRVLLKNTPKELVDERLFDILSHFKSGIDLIADPKEKLQLAHLWVRAAIRAKQSTAAENGSEYASFAKRMLGENSWMDHYDLTFQLYQVLAECDYMRGNYEMAEQLYPEMLKFCKNNLDRMVVYQIKMIQLEKQQRYGEVIENCRQCLLLYGVTIPSLDNSNDKIKELLQMEVRKVGENLKERKVSDLYKIDKMKEEWQRAVAKSISFVWASTYCMGQKEYMALISCIAFNKFLEYGSSDVSSLICCNFAFSWDVLEIEAQFAFDVSVLGCSLLEIYPNEPIRSHCYFPFAIGVSHVIMPLQYGFSFLERGYESALECGDIPYACYTIHHILTHRYFRGINLLEVKLFYQNNFPFLEKNNKFIWNYGIGSSQSFRWHIGDHSQSEEIFLSRKENDGMYINLGSYYTACVQIAMWNNSQDWKENFRILDLSLKYLVGITGFYHQAETLFSSLMVIMRAIEAGYLETIESERKRKYLDLMRTSFSEFEQLAKSCPSNNNHKYLILLSQKAKLEGDFFQSVLFLNKAKESALEFQFTQYEALSNELLGRLWEEKGQRQYAKQHLEEAYRLYQIWGSASKVTQLLSAFPEYLELVKTTDNPQEILDSESKSQPQNEKIEKPTALDNSNINIDLQSMVKVSEAAAMEMSLEQLLDSMMRLVIENAGAQKGIFLLAESSGEMLVVAEGDIDKMQVDSLRAIPLSSVADYPHAIINYVARTKETIIIGDAMKKGPVSFETSHYVQLNQVKSILCCPIVKNSAFKGVIYLENNLTNNAFNEQRAKIVSAISLQMSIHLDNAKFSQLLESEKRFRALATELEIVKKGLEEFIDVLCHELRNPLNGIYGSKQLMTDQLNQFRKSVQEKKDNLPKDLVEHHLTELEDMLEAVSVSSDHLKDIVDTVLTVSMLEKQTIKLQNIPFRPSDVVEKVGLMYKARLLEKGLYFNSIPQGEEVSAMGDPHRLSQVLINIVSNSIKFMEKGGITIEYRSEVKEDKVTLSFVVKDTGIGLTEAEIAKLFKPFAQANSNIYTKYGGSGLGLKISKEIIELMGGNISLESVKGVGTSCKFHIVCQKAPVQDSKNSKKRHASQMENNNMNYSPVLSNQAAHPNKIVAHNNAPKNRRILVVEDNSINQKLMKRILESEGYSTDVADNGKEAYEKVRCSYGTTHQYYAILMDMEMPVMNGVESTQKIRQYETENNISNCIPIIGVSANARDTHSQTAIGVGMNSYITKPFQKKDIFDAIEKGKS